MLELPGTLPGQRYRLLCRAKITRFEHHRFSLFQRRARDGRCPGADMPPYLLPKIGFAAGRAHPTPCGRKMPSGKKALPMPFDEQVFRMAMKKLTAEGNRDAVEDYLLSEFWRLEEGDIAVADSCCCREIRLQAGRGRHCLAAEPAAGANHRRGRRTPRDFYRESKEWRRCFDIYQSLAETVRQGGLSDTEVYGEDPGSTAPMRCWTTAKKNRRWS